MLIYKYVPGDAETVIGIWSGNTDYFSGGMCRQVYVKSASTDTTFDVTITDEHDIDVRKWTGQTYVVNDLTPFYVRGIYTIAISGATADEAFDVMMMVKDV